MYYNIIILAEPLTKKHFEDRYSETGHYFVVCCWICVVVYMSTLGQIPINRVAELVTVNLNLNLILLFSLYIVQHFRVHVDPTISEPLPLVSLPWKRVPVRQSDLSLMEAPENTKRHSMSIKIHINRGNNLVSYFAVT